MKNKALHTRIGFAIAGLREGWLRERSFRTQVAAAALVFLALIILRPAAIWWAMIVLIVGVVMALELMNSALEALVDHLHPDRHPQIRIVKDMAAGSVLLVSLAAVLIAIALVSTFV